MDFPADIISKCAVFRRMRESIHSGGHLTLRGQVGSSVSMLAAAISRSCDRPCLLVVAHLDEADEACDELQSFGASTVRFPALEVLPGESNLNLELLRERLAALQTLDGEDTSRIVVAPITALMQQVPDESALSRLSLRIARGERVPLKEVLRWLVDAGYRRVDAVENDGEYSVRGGILDVFSPGGLPPARIEFFGDEIERLWEVDLDTMGSDRSIDAVEYVAVNADIAHFDSSNRSLIDVLPQSTVAFLSDVMEISEQGRGYWERLTDGRGVLPPGEILAAVSSRCHAVVEGAPFAAGAVDGQTVDLPVRVLPPFSEEPGEAIDELRTLAQNARVTVFCQNEGERSRFRELIRDHAPESEQAQIGSETRYLHRGFVWDQTESSGETNSYAFVPYHELLHRYHARRRVRRVSTGRAIDTFLDLEPGDFVVHRDHGVARFVEFGPLEQAATAKGQSHDEEFLTLEFDKGARLHVPASQIDAVQKYVGGFHGKPALSILGGRKWKKQKDDAAEAAREFAKEMLQIQAAREALPGVRFPSDTVWQREFEAEFPYEETEDQLSAIASVKKDMTNNRPMDRLVCGDVGFGKTEIAIRAAFKSAEFGKQVAVLVPTTVLAEQHEQTFRGRFADYPFRIESLSRFKTRKEQNAILKEVMLGRVDIIIGTHRLLSKDVKFADLGLVIVDEEQRFGVEHKQRLLQFRMTADVLTLSATPIPRTLHMSLLGLRDISSLTTPPADRRSIVTEVLPYDKRRIQRALERELAREGQVFFVHNRVHDIESVADDVQKLVPDARIVIGHGQMPPRDLERVMLQFMRRQADILVSTTIIESGIDIPTANTMIIHDADMFGLSELHQLRGRVGRYKHRAYCYLLLPDDRTLTEQAVRRLRAVEDYSMLGAGFKIAMRDLEIRGAGSLLGVEQSGHISAVGYEMYCELLQQAVHDLKSSDKPTRLDCLVSLGVHGSLTRHYIPSDVRRLEAYRRISRAVSIEDVRAIEHDLTTAYGEPPKTTRLLLELAAIRALGAAIGVKSIVRHDDDIIFRTTKPRLLEERMRGVMGSLRLVGQADKQSRTEIYFRPPRAYLETESLLTVLRRRLSGDTAERLRTETQIANAAAKSDTVVRS